VPDTSLDPPARSIRGLPSAVIPLLAGAAVSVALGIYGRAHDPTGRTLYTFFFSDTSRLKAWLSTGVLALAVTQPFTGRWLSRSRQAPAGTSAPAARPAPVWLGDLHRLIGTTAFALSLPVAYHCLWALGYQSPNTRVAVHSLVGCAFYGAFAAKIITVRRPDQPAWAAPLVGALTLSLVVVVWWTSAFWFFDNVTLSP
jgi:hypothetical protein